MLSRRIAFASDFSPLLLSTSLAVLASLASKRLLPGIGTSVFEPRSPRVFAFLCDEVSAILLLPLIQAKKYSGELSLENNPPPYSTTTADYTAGCTGPATSFQLLGGRPPSSD